jgi:hypothetical protein
MNNVKDVHLQNPHSFRKLFQVIKNYIFLCLLRSLVDKNEEPFFNFFQYFEQNKERKK